MKFDAPGAIKFQDLTPKEGHQISRPDPIGEMRALIVDGYNLIHSHPRLSSLVRTDMDSAREGLVRELMPLAAPDFFGLVMVVFDAASWGGQEPVVEDRGGLVVVFTRRRQTADSFIEAAARALLSGGHASSITVATSDRALRVVTEGFGALSVNTESLLKMVDEAKEEVREEMRKRTAPSRHPLEERVTPEIRALLDHLRKGSDLEF